MNIDRKLTGTQIGLVLAIILIVGVLGYRLIAATLQDAQAEKLQLLAGDITFHFEQELSGLGDAVRTIANSRAMAIYMDDFDDRPLREILAQKQNHFDDIRILNEKGSEELRFPHHSSQGSVRTFTYDEGFLDARWTPNEPIIRLEATGGKYTPRITLTYVKKNFFDQFGGAVRAGNDLSAVLGEIIKPPPYTFVLVLDPNARIAYRFDARDKLPGLGSTLNCEAEQSNTRFVNCNDEPAFFLRRELNDSGWLLLAGIHKEDFYAPMVSTRNTILKVLAPLLVAAIIMTTLLGRHIARPLSQLAAASRRLAAGNRDVAVRIHRNDEVGELGQAFNQMSQSLQRSNEERDQALQGMAAANQELRQSLSQLNLARERIEYMAYYDELTGLANRRLMMNRVEKALAASARRAKSGAVMMLDLDRFKFINDSLGHEAGDDLLQQVGRRLTDLVRKEDSVCRLGGDEFVLLFPQIDIDGDDILGPIAHTAEKIREALAEPYRLGLTRYQTTASIGVVIFPSTDDNADDLLKRADTAMYRAKRDGGNKVRFYQIEMQHAAYDRLNLEKDLQESLHNGGFFLHYQPQCDVDGNVLGAEALVRWKHPERGTVSPAEFIQVAEEIGLIVPLGEWILEQAASDMMPLLSAAGPGRLRTIAVNVSPHQFRDESFTDTVSRLISDYGIPPGRLKLELTEYALLCDDKDTVKRMNKLRRLGVHFSLDDFGTGYSALSYLSNLPLDELKIDRSFLLNATSKPHTWIIIESVIDIARALNLSVIVEGVETEEEANKLHSLGCRCFQGYYFARPMDLASIRRLLNSAGRRAGEACAGANKLAGSASF